MPKKKSAAIDNTQGYDYEELLDLFERNFRGLNKEKLNKCSPYIIASLLERIDITDCYLFLNKIDDERQIAAILSETDPRLSVEVIKGMPESEAIGVLESMDLDDAVGIIRHIDAEERLQLLGKLKSGVATEIYRLLSYNSDTAGGIMNPRVPVVGMEVTVEEAMRYLRKFKHSDDIYEIYVVDGKKQLTGMTTLKDMIFVSPTRLVASFMQTEIPSLCFVGETKEVVSQRMAENNVRTMPVVDEKNHLLGVISHDDVLDIIQDQATEDLQKLHGAGADEGVHDSVFYSFCRRNHWLFFNLLTAVCAAFVTYQFRYPIEKLSILAVLMTIVASLGGNAGAQTLAVTIRGMAIGDLRPEEWFPFLVNETFKGFINGLVIGVIAFLLMLFFLKDSLREGVVIGVSLMLNMGVSGFMGAFIPLVLRRFNFDPVQSSYIFLTAVTDILGLLIFLSLGTYLLL